MKNINKILLNVLIVLVVIIAFTMIYDIKREIAYNDDPILLDIHKRIDSLEKKDIIKKQLQEKLEKKMLDSSVTVYSVRQKGMGSGTVIKKTWNATYILTCYHVISAYFEEELPDAEKITIGYNNVLYPVDVLKIDKEHDLALLKVYFNDPNLVAVNLAKENQEKAM